MASLTPLVISCTRRLRKERTAQDRAVHSVWRELRRAGGDGSASQYNIPITKLHVSMAQFMGVHIDGFGAPYDGLEEVGRLSEIFQ